MKTFKLFLKKVLSLACKIFLLPIFTFHKINSIFSKSERFFYDSAQLLSLFPGTLGNFFRKEFYKFFLKKCSDTCCIGFGTIISHPEAEIGDNVYIGLNCTIGTATIGDDVLIGSNVDILDGKKQHSFDSLEIPIRMQKKTFERINIGGDSWIGNSSVVMSNIGIGCIVGAGSVVINDINDYCVVVGNPAKVVKTRK